MAVPLAASTRASVLKELVSLGGAVVAGLRSRRRYTTPSASARKWPAPPCPPASPSRIRAVLCRPPSANPSWPFGRTASGIPFGAPHGWLTDMFFLVCCRDDRTHLRVLARLTRLFMRPGFLDELRAAETPHESREKIVAAEQQLLQS